MRRNAGKSRAIPLIGGAIGLLTVAFLVFVPVRDCRKCLGTGGVPLKIGDAVDLGCKHCGGDGRQSVLQVLIGEFRK
jgi:hypothetical protein